MDRRNTSFKAPAGRRHKQHFSLSRSALGILFSLLLIAPVTHAAKIEATVSADRNEIFEGESVTLSVKVSNFESGMDPDLSQIKDCTISSLGFQDRSVRSIINGHATSFSGRIFSYSITPLKTGRIKLFPIIINRGKHKRSFTGPTIRVRGIEKQNFVLMSIEPSDPEVIVDEPFTVDFKLFIKKLSPPYADASPIPLDDPPHLEIPYLRDDCFDGLECPKIQPLMQAMVVSNPRTPGITLNNFTISSFSFFDNNLARFDFSPVDTTINGVPYQEYSLTLRYVPTAEGSYTFGPVTFKGRIYTGVTANGRGIAKSVYAIAPARTVRVIPPPIENRPDSYIGAIATNVSVKASLDAQTCKVGDPLTLTLKISGNLQLDNLTPPKLGQQANIMENFRIYESNNGKTKDNTRIYEYTVRPTKAGTYEFPPVEVSFYNPRTKQYQTIATKPIPIRARPASEFNESTVIDTAEQSVTITGTADDPAAQIPAPVDIAPIVATTPIFIPRLHLPLLLAGPALLLALLFIRQAEKHIPALARRRRRRLAASKALHRIKSAVKNSDPYSEIAAAMREYAATRLNLNAASATPSEIYDALIKHGIPADSAKQFADLLEQNFNSSFNSEKSDAAIVDSISDARAALKKLEEALRK